MARNIIKRIKESDFKTINSWYRARHMKPVPREEYPHVGFMVNNICAGWIYQTDSSIVFVDGFISDPYSDKIARENALDELSITLLNFSHQRGFSKILVYTSNPSVKKRCRKYGFTYHCDQSLYGKGV